MLDEYWSISPAMIGFYFLFLSGSYNEKLGKMDCCIIYHSNSQLRTGLLHLNTNTLLLPMVVISADLLLVLLVFNMNVSGEVGLPAARPPHDDLI